MQKKLRGVFLAGALLMLLTGTASAMAVPDRDIWVTENGKTTLYQTSAETVGAFLNEQVYIINEGDRLSLPLDYTLVPQNTTRLEIYRGVNVNVFIDGKKEVVSLPPDSRLGTVVKKMEDKYGEEFAYAGKANDLLTDKQNVNLSSFVEEESIVTEILPYDTIFEMDDQLDKGQIEIVQLGVEGEKQIIYSVTKLHGESLSQKVTEEVISKEPVVRILKQGTRPPKVVEPPAAQTLVDIGRKYTLNASAYHAGPESTGKSPGDPGYGITASGMKAQRGVVAVDPKLIPLGTRLYIDGYGYAIAGDTGGRIVGHTIDLFFEELEECLEFGRRDITVYVLDN